MKIEEARRLAREMRTELREIIYRGHTDGAVRYEGGVRYEEGVRYGVPYRANTGRSSNV